MKTFIFILYIFYLPFRMKIPQLPMGTIVDIFNVIFLGMLIFEKKRSNMRPKFELPLLFFLFIWIGSFFYAMYQSIQSMGIPVIELLKEFKRVITLPIGYFVFAYLVKSKKELRFFFYVLLISFAIIGFYTFRTGILEGPSFSDHKRGFGPFGESWRAADIAGGYLAMFGPFLFSFFLFTKKKVLKLIGVGGFISILVGVLSTYSRGSLIAIIAGSAIVFISSFKIHLKQSKILVVILCIIGTLGIIKWRYWIPEPVINRIDDTVNDRQREASLEISNLDIGTQRRITTWQRGLDVFFEHPIMGIGFCQLKYQIYYVPNYDPHNGFIKIMAEMGSLGILVFLWLLWNIFIEAKTLIKSEFNVLGAGFIGCLVALIVVNMFYSNIFRDNVVGSFWIMLGLLAASKRFVAQEKSMELNKKNNKKRNVSLVSVLAFFFLITPLTFAKTDSRWWNADDVKNLRTYEDFAHTPIGRNYYVDGMNGNDDNLGNSLNHPLRTIGKTVKKLMPGDIVLIKAGVYREGRINISQRGTAENRIIIGPLGDGEVVIDASMDIGDWIYVKKNIYRAECSEKPITVVFDNKPLFPEYTLDEVNEGKWYYDKNEKMLYLYAQDGVNPNKQEIGVVADSAKQHAIFLNGAQYLTLYGLTIKYAGGNGVEVLGNNNRIERCDIRFNGKNGIGMFNYGDKVSDNTEIIKNNIFHNFLQNWPRGKNRWKNGGWGKGITGHGVPHSKIIGNIVHKNGGEGIGAVGEGAIIRDNIVFDNWSVNIYVCNEKNILIERNLIYCHDPVPNELYNNGDKNSNDGKSLRRLRAEGIMTADETNPATMKNVRIINNIIIGCRRGITHYSGTKGSGMKDVLVAHNTIIVPDAKGVNEEYVGIKIPYNDGNNSNTVFCNNIVYATHPNTYLLQIKTDPLNLHRPLNGLSFNNNIWYHLTKKKPFHVGPAWFRTDDMYFTTWLKKINYPEQEKGSRYIDPGFIIKKPFTAGTVKLIANSKAIDAGSKIDGINNDYDDNHRSDGLPDIGAFEFIK